VMDAQADQGLGGAASGVSNTVAADYILKAWADSLRKRLEAARTVPSG
jgi:hypothetical protein